MSDLLFQPAQTSAKEALIQENLNKRIIVLNDDVDEKLIENCELYIFKWNAEDRDKPIEKRQKIKLYVNSYGGDAYLGGQLATLVQVSETPIVGVGLSIIASAAFHIFIACSERIAFDTTVFLLHEGNTELSSNSMSKVKDTVEFFDTMDEYYKKNTFENSKISEEYYQSVYTKELWMYADKAKELGFVDKIIGQDCSLDEIL